MATTPPCGSGRPPPRAPDSRAANLLEFALGSHPMIPDAAAPILLDLSTEPATVRLTQRTDRPGVTVLLETTPVLGQAWTPVPTEVGFTSGFQQLRIARQPTGSPTRFFRLSAPPGEGPGHQPGRQPGRRDRSRGLNRLPTNR